MRDAERAAASGDVEPAIQLLAALVGTIDERHAYLSRRCVELATRAEAHDLALHYALCFYVATSGRRDIASLVGRAAARVPSLEGPAARVALGIGLPEDWSAIAEADPYALWPQITALGTGGRHSARTLDELRRAGRIDAIGDEGLRAWRIDSARLSWDGRCCAVGSSETTSGSSHHFVPELSDHHPGAALRWMVSEPTRTSGVVGLVVRRFSFIGYYHWLVEGLHDVMVLHAAGLLDRRDRIVICAREPLPPFIAESLDALGFDSSRFDIRTMPFDEAGGTVIKPTLTPVPLTDHVRRLRQRIGLGRGRRGGRRLLVSRKDAAWRRVHDESELEAALAPFGFETIVPGHLSFRDQVDAFSSAEIVVAPHGAAMSNLAFAHPGTSVVELVPESSQLTCYRDIADVVGVRYARLLCPPVPQTPGDLQVDVAALVHLVQSTLPSG